MPSDAPNPHWYFLESDLKQGPFSGAEFQELVRSGRISPDAWVWRGGFDTWRPFGALSPADLQDGGSTEAAVLDWSRCAECARLLPAADGFRFGDLWICAACKPRFVQKIREGLPLPGSPRFAGFWIRGASEVIDWMLLSVVNTIFAVGLGWISLSIDEMMALALHFLLILLQLVIGVLYSTYMIGRFGATFGKMLCRLKVVDIEGNRISYLRAMGRSFAKFLSGVILYIGYIMAAFDEEKRGLHDRICATRVVQVP